MSSPSSSLQAIIYKFFVIAVNNKVDFAESPLHDIASKHVADLRCGYTM